MNKVTFFIDGFNLYHALEHNPQYRKYKWLDLDSLSRKYLKKSDQLAGVYYFTALAHWNQNKVRKHRAYINALTVQGVEVVYGKFREVDKRCLKCGRWYTTHEEKQTDVNIALKLAIFGLQDKYDTAVIVSGDSDLVPAIHEVKQTFPGKQFGALIPIGRRAKFLKANCDFAMKMKQSHLANSLLPDSVKLTNGKVAICPPSWK